MALRDWLSALRSLTSTRRSLAERAQEIHVLRSDVEELRKREAADAEQLRKEEAAHVEWLQSEATQRIEQLRNEAMQRIEQLRNEESERAKQVRDEVRSNVQEVQANISEMVRLLQEEQGRARTVTTELSGDLRNASSSLRQVVDRIDRLAPEFPELPNLGSADSAGWFYASFEETFRGTRELVTQRLQAYLPYIQSLRANETVTRAVDLGCGRGEWLELIQGQGIDALGVDLNQVTLERCRQRGLNVVRGDVLDFIRAQPSGTFDLITSFHVIEHLPMETLLALLLEARRVIRPGGIVILETPNPQNIVVAASSFYLDPTHRHPLPGALLRFLVEWARFEIVEILSLHPDDALLDVATREGWPPTLQRLLSGPQDIGVVGRAMPQVSSEGCAW